VLQQLQGDDLGGTSNVSCVQRILNWHSIKGLQCHPSVQPATAFEVTADRSAHIAIVLMP